MTELPARSDVVVIGLGAAGSAALSFLARAGVNVVGIDRYSPPHDMGSSHGETRMLRTAYSEGAAYVPMVQRAIVLWRELERRTGTSLFHQTGVLYGGPRSSGFLNAARQSAKQSGVQLIETNDQGFPVPDGWLELVDVAGGYLDAEASIAAFLEDAKAHGAAIFPNCTCRDLETADGNVVATADAGAIRARRAIVTAGAWSRELLVSLDRVTHVERRVLHWYEDVGGRYRADCGFRPFLITTEDDAGFYGFPANARGEVKVAEHFGVEKIVSPEELERIATTKDIALIEPLVRRFMPGLGRHVHSSVCMYPMSRDEHFIVDRAARPEIMFAAGLSGHGFKFAPVIGEALANFALDRKQEIDVGFFSLSRFPEFRDQ